jgi:hypothetical protein
MPSSDLKKDSSLVMMPQRRCEFATGGVVSETLCALLRNSTGARGFVIGLPSGASGFTLRRSQNDIRTWDGESKIQDRERREGEKTRGMVVLYHNMSFL